MSPTSAYVIPYAEHPICEGRVLVDIVFVVHEK
jgi:hypothetical protein